jgi:hypothetical protein
LRRNLADLAGPRSCSRRRRRSRRACSRLRRVLSGRTGKRQNRQYNLIYSRQRNRRRARLEIAALRVNALVRVGVGQLGHNEQTAAEKVRLRVPDCRTIVRESTRWDHDVAGGAAESSVAVCCRDSALDSEVAGPFQVIATRSGQGAMLLLVSPESSLAAG